MTILGARASTDRSDCAVAVAFDASSARATVQCSAAGFVSVYVTVLTDRGPKEERHVLEFRDPPTNDDTLCNDSADAGPSDDASD